MQVKYGDIFNLGRHRLMCGDACKHEDIKKLISDANVDFILTDPPYGMKCQEKSGIIGEKRGNCKGWRLKNNVYPVMIGDNNQDTARINYELTQDLTKYKIIFGGQYFAHFLPINGGWIFWDKQTGTTNFSDGELAWRSWGKKVTKYIHKWNGVCRQGNRKLNGKSRYHPTQKPVELFASILEDFCVSDGIVLDCFGGSGTTLLACEVIGRTCLMMELLPEYCEIIIKRWKELDEFMNQAIKVVR